MMRKITDAFLSAWALMSRIPLPQPRTFMPAGIPYFFPLIGLIASSFTALVMRYALALSGDPFTGVIAALAIQYWAFNLFHYDGLLDSMDALLSFKSKTERLAVLGDSHHGTFALFFGIIYLLLKIHILESSVAQFNESYFLLIFCYPMAGRLSPLVVMAALAPAKTSGLGAQIGKLGVLKGAGILLIGITITGIIAGIASGGVSVPGLVITAMAASAAIGSGLIVALLYRIKIGGFTGDALGFTVELGELLYLLLLYSLVR